MTDADERELEALDDEIQQLREELCTEGDPSRRDYLQRTIRTARSEQAEIARERSAESHWRDEGHDRGWL